MPSNYVPGGSMNVGEDRYKDIDANIAANVRAFREARGISQEDLAARLAEAGFPFSQATIWKIENGRRPVKSAEQVALADALEADPWTLTRRPETGKHLLNLKQANNRAYVAWHQVKVAASEYIDAQYDLVIAAHDARKAGIVVAEWQVTWLTVTPEEAVIDARLEEADEAERAEKLGARRDKILAALRASGYEPHLRVGDVTVGAGAPSPAWEPKKDPILPTRATEAKEVLCLHSANALLSASRTSTASAASSRFAAGRSASREWASCPTPPAGQSAMPRPGSGTSQT